MEGMGRDNTTYDYQNTRGRKAKDIEMMLRMYLMHNWFNLFDERIEDAIYDSYAMKKILEDRLQ